MAFQNSNSIELPPFAGGLKKSKGSKKFSKS